MAKGYSVNPASTEVKRILNNINKNKTEIQRGLIVKKSNAKNIDENYWSLPDGRNVVAYTIEKDYGFIEFANSKNEINEKPYLLLIHTKGSKYFYKRFQYPNEAINFIAVHRDIEGSVALGDLFNEAFTNR